MRLMKLSTVYLAVLFWGGTIHDIFAQGNEPTKECLAAQRVKSVTTYHIFEPSDTLRAQWKKTDSEAYDKAGNQLLWKQFAMDLADSVTYSTRKFTFNGKGQLIKTVDCTEGEAECTVDSLRLDENGLMTYRKMLRRPGKVLFEHETILQVERNRSKQLVKIDAFDKKNVLLSQEKWVYNAGGKLLSDKIFVNNAVVQQTIYRYNKGDKLGYVATIKGEKDTLETKAYDDSACLVREVKFDEEIKGETSYVIARSYDSRSRETQNMTYSTYGKRLVATRRETTTYAETCLRTGTRIYSIDQFTGKQTLYTIIKYAYSFY